MTKKNSTKAKKLPKKLEKAWIAYLIDTAVGSQLLMIGMRYPEKAEKMNQILTTAINDMFSKKRKTMADDPAGLVYAARIMAVELTDTFIATQLLDTLFHGMPERKIIQPVPGSPLMV